MYNAPLTPVFFGNAPRKSSEVSIPVIEHGKLHVGSGHFSVLKIMNTIAISHGPRYGHKTWSALETHHEKSSEVFIPVLEHMATFWQWSRFRAQHYD